MIIVRHFLNLLNTVRIELNASCAILPALPYDLNSRAVYFLIIFIIKPSEITTRGQIPRKTIVNFQAENKANEVHVKPRPNKDINSVHLYDIVVLTCSTLLFFIKI